MSFGSSSSMLSSLFSFRTRSSVDLSDSPTPDLNEVYPGLYVGDAVAAEDKAFLRRMGINYVLNTAEGKGYAQVDTGHLYYSDCPGLRYKGFPLTDLPTTDISKYFHIAANFIDEGLSRGAVTAGGCCAVVTSCLCTRELADFLQRCHRKQSRVLVHCFKGLSRSATCAIAFLMIKRGMSLTEALALVRSRRDIHPNDGFIRQLQLLDCELKEARIR